MHGRAVHNAIKVERFVWLGSLVDGANTDAADISTPDLSAISRRKSVPVHT